MALRTSSEKRLITYTAIATGNMGFLLFGEALVQVGLVNCPIEEVEFPLKLIESLAYWLPAFAIAVAALDVLHIVKEVVGLVSQVMEPLANTLGGQVLMIILLLMCMLIVDFMLILVMAMLAAEIVMIMQTVNLVVMLFLTRLVGIMLFVKRLVLILLATLGTKLAVFEGVILLLLDVAVIDWC